MSIALWCLFIAGLLHVLSKTPLFRAQHKSPEGYDNNNPREQQASLNGLGKRALAAHQNQIESFPLFATGILVATATGMVSSAIDYLAIAYIVARVAYIFYYLNDRATLRTIVWGVGFISSLALLCSPAWA
ncbi:MAPEG family protein [Oceanospirillaceae bacterium]|nr:MAPEG family protein [Oceanospirillaceae bacterium]